MGHDGSQDRPQPAARPDRSEQLLRLEGVSRSFGAREVVRSLDLQVARGERVAFCGPNGSGKTTVLRCIVGTLTPTSGGISIGGHEAGSLEARRLVGVSFSQERSFYLRLSGRDNLLFSSGVRGRSRKEAFSEVCELCSELELETILATRADRCSTGMIQQLAFARALIGEPELLLLDEPTRSLDHDAVARLWAAVGRRRETALVIATHNEDDIERCDRRIDFPVS
jgi:ABC-2 type transport system ATP-binding protein